MALAAARDQVLAQAREAELQARQQIAQQRSQDYQQAIRVREKQAEVQAAAAARKMLGMQNFQKKIEGGMDPAKALASEAENLFADNPARFATAMRALRPPPGLAPLGPEAYTARQILDESGKPIGMSAIPGRGAARVLTQARSQLSPEGKMRGLTTQITILQKQLEEAKKADRPGLEAQRDELMKQLDALIKGKPLAAGAVMSEDFDATGRVPGKEDESIEPPLEDEEEEE